MNCSKCSSSVHWLEIFPNNLCLDCYRVSEQANKDMTADELGAMFEESVGE